MTDQNELRKRLKKEYNLYKNVEWTLKHQSAYGNWYYQMQDWQTEVVNAQKKVVNEIMPKLGYDKWTKEDVEKELKRKPVTNQSRTLKKTPNR